MTKRDAVVVGAGIVGLAVAREVLRRRPGASVAVIERESQVAAHQTGHNSGVIHSGIYYEPGSLKARLCVEGAAMMYAYAQEMGIAHERCGKLIVAVSPAELGRLDELERRGAANKVPGLRRVDANGIRDIEPQVVGISALQSPNTGIIDYVQVSRAIQRELVDQGVAFHFDTQVEDVAERGTSCIVRTDRGSTAASQVILCAGLWSDRLATRSGADPSPRVVPFRGQYLQLRHQSMPMVRGMVYPVPDPTLPFLGVHITKQVDGQVLLGPTAMLVPSRDGYRLRTLRGRDIWETATWPGTWRMARRFWRVGVDEIHLAVSKQAHVRAASRYLPSLTTRDIDPVTRSGVRAQAIDRAGALVDDFAISQIGSIAHIRNAPSPAATSAFALAREIVDRVDAR